MKDALKISELKDYFRLHSTVTQSELYIFYRHYDPGLNKSTLRWRIHQLKNRGVLSSVSRGNYTFSVLNEWSPGISYIDKALFHSLQHLNSDHKVCCWSTRWLSPAITKGSLPVLILIETDRDSIKTVSDFIKLSSIKRPYHIQTGRGKTSIPFSTEQDTLVIKPLVSQAPLTRLDGIVIPKPEKILADVVADHLFDLYSEEIIHAIYHYVFRNFVINRNTLKRYAGRRGCWQQVWKIVRLYQQESKKQEINEQESSKQESKRQVSNKQVINRQESKKQKIYEQESNKQESKRQETVDPVSREEFASSDQHDAPPAAPALDYFRSKFKNKR